MKQLLLVVSVAILLCPINGGKLTDLIRLWTNLPLFSERGQACCNLGKYHGGQGECLQPSNDHMKADNLSAEDCETYYSLCCGSVLKKKLCDFGVQRARNDANCSTLRTGEGSQTQYMCCMVCRDGIEMARNRTSCSTISRDDKVIEDASVDCCRREEVDVRNEDAKKKYHKDRCPKYGCQQQCKDLGPDRDVLCGCNDGFQLAADKKTCLDKDECVWKDTCGPDEDCINTVGGKMCIKKVKKDENMTRSESGPTTREIVVPRNSSQCPPGYKNHEMNTNLCVDVNECDLPDIDCGNDMDCINLYGSYYCSEKVPWWKRIKGASISPETVQCKSFGLKLNGTNCVDIDECMIGSHSCILAREECKNIYGSYYCSPKSSTSTTTTPIPEITFFIPSPASFRRGLADPETDVESETDDFITTGHGSIPRSIGAVPRPRIQLYTPRSIPLPPGSEDTICERGFELSNHTNDCEDIDECDLKSHKCPHNSECINIEGSYTCKCQTGFEFLNGLCQDIDECKFEDRYRGPCDNNLQCFNGYGSFECKCPEKHVLNPRTKFCDRTEEKGVECGIGFVFNSTTKNCDDINECEQIDPCPMRTPGTVCSNTYGSYWCVPFYERTETTTRAPRTQVLNPTPYPRLLCSVGYELDEWSRQCKDVDECLNPNSCPVDKLCENLPGSFACLQKPCLFSQVNILIVQLIS